MTPTSDLASPADLAAPSDLSGSAVPRETGSVITLIESEVATKDKGQYQPPSDAERASFAQAMRFLLSGEGERALPLLLPLGFGLTDFTDTTLPAQPKRFYVARERTGVRRYLGLFLVRRDIDLSVGTGRIVLEVPYANDSSLDYLKQQAARVLVHSDAGALLMNTADRCAEESSVGTCTRCANPSLTTGCVRCLGVEKLYYPTTDQGRADKTLFQAAHEVLVTDPRVGVFLGGLLTVTGVFAGTTTYVSDGTRNAAAQSLAGSLRANLEQALADAGISGQAAALCKAADASGAAAPLDLCGETLVQGRQSNLMVGANLCQATAPMTATGRYLVLNQTFTLRKNDGQARTDLPNVVGAALWTTFQP